MALIQVNHLTRSYGELFALKDVSFEVEKGEWIALMGPSGSGKTTLVNLLAGLDRPTSGQILVDGTDLAPLSGADLVKFRRENIGIVFQQHHLIPYLTALENVMLAQYFHSMADRDEAIQALKEVGLQERVNHLPSQLSGGEQQRVCIARALINHPKLVLADEPTGNLDEANEAAVLEIFLRLHNAGHTLVMVTHDVQVGRLANRRLELRHGTLTGVAKLPRELDELFDEVLQQMWEMSETEGSDCSDHPTYLEDRSLVSAMIDSGLILSEDSVYRLTDKGYTRAKDIVRRHRLAERMFRDVLYMKGNEQIESNACAFEHVISPELEESICRMLNHPGTCPHGRPIPKGGCCP